MTQKGKDLNPILIEFILWSYKYEPETEAVVEFENEAIYNRESLMDGILSLLE